MKKLTKGKMLSKKTIAIIMTALIVTSSALYIGINTYKNNNTDLEFTAREREYKVTRGNITSGAKGVGILKFEGISHSFADSVVIGEIFVNEGQNVVSGDKLISISEKYIDEKLEELNKSLNQAQIALEQAQGDKEITILNNSKAWNDKVQASRRQYESQRGEMETNISSLNDKLSSITAQLEEVTKQINNCEENKGNENNSLEELKVKQESLILEKESIQGELSIANANLSKLDENRSKEVKSEAEENSTNTQINNITLNSQDALINNAREEVNKITEDINKFNILKESPILYAKSSGVVSAIKVSPGDTVVAGTAIMDIGESSKVTAEITVSQSDIVNIEEGQDVKLEIAAHEGNEFKGKVKRINLKPTTQGTSTTYTVIVELDTNDFKLLEGMTVNAQFIIKEVKGVLRLSNKAIELRDGRQFVKVKNEDGTVKEVEIKTGFSDGKSSEIISGLNENDTVVVGG